MLAYVQAKQAQVKVSSIRNLTSHLAAFGEFLTSNYPSLASLSVLRREHVEAYCVCRPGDGEVNGPATTRSAPHR
jgi:hypothetical protein